MIPSMSAVARWVWRGATPFVIAVLLRIFVLKRAYNRGLGFFNPRDPQRPPDLNQVNNSVWELYSPPTGSPDVDILFFHGLQLGDFDEAFWRTFVARDDNDTARETVWPQKWLPKKFPRARILSVSYNSSATQCEGQPDMYALGENLVGDIICSADYAIGQNCPVFLVGHSLGGIVIKTFINYAIKKRGLINPETDARRIERVNTFLGNVKGTYYYATPHQGSRIADLANVLPGTSPILGLLRTLNTERTRINEEFRQHRGILHARAFAVAEGRRTVYGMFRDKVVEEASARYDIDDFYTDSTADHFTVCKARNMEDPAVIGLLVEFINDVSNGTITYSRQQGASTSELL